VLSLVVVPAFFLIMDDLSNLLGRIFRSVIGPKEVEAEVPDPLVLADRLSALEARLSPPVPGSKPRPLEAAE
jgi:hypothetical protein